MSSPVSSPVSSPASRTARARAVSGVGQSRSISAFSAAPISTASAATYSHAMTAMAADSDPYTDTPLSDPARKSRSPKLPPIQMSSARTAPGRSRCQGVRTGTLRWYSVARKMIDSVTTTGQYSACTSPALSGSACCTSAGPATSSGMTVSRTTRPTRYRKNARSRVRITPRMPDSP